MFFAKTPTPTSPLGIGDFIKDNESLLETLKTVYPITHIHLGSGRLVILFESIELAVKIPYNTDGYHQNQLEIFIYKNFPQGWGDFKFAPCSENIKDIAVAEDETSSLLHVISKLRNKEPLGAIYMKFVKPLKTYSTDLPLWVYSIDSIQVGYYNNNIVCYDYGYPHTMFIKPPPSSLGVTFGHPFLS